MTCVIAEPLASATTDPSAAPTARCRACESSGQRLPGGQYRMQCLECCARLVASTYPNRQAAAAMMVVVKRSIARFAPTFGPADVTERARQMLERRR